jgi:hypothetical protein
MEINDATPRHPVLAAGGRVLGHIAAMVLGLIMMFAGLALGVTMVMLPVGLPLGLGGLLLLLWGAAMWSRTKQVPM